jgi:hypothetical protein
VGRLEKVGLQRYDFVHRFFVFDDSGRRHSPLPLNLNPAVHEESGGQEGNFRPCIARIMEPVTENEAQDGVPALG